MSARACVDGEAPSLTLVSTFFTGSRRASGARASGPPPCRACGLSAVPGAAAAEARADRWMRTSRIAHQEPPTRRSTVRSTPVCVKGAAASLRDGLRPPLTQPLRRAACSAVELMAPRARGSCEPCTPGVPPTLQREHRAPRSGHCREHAVDSGQMPEGLRNEKARGSNPLSSTMTRLLETVASSTPRR